MAFHAPRVAGSFPGELCPSPPGRHRHLSSPLPGPRPGPRHSHCLRLTSAFAFTCPVPSAVPGQTAPRRVGREDASLSVPPHPPHRHPHPTRPLPPTPACRLGQFEVQGRHLTLRRKQPSSRLLWQIHSQAECHSRGQQPLGTLLFAALSPHRVPATGTPQQRAVLHAARGDGELLERKPRLHWQPGGQRLLKGWGGQRRGE